ncbi:MAG: DUF4189 domain-containing protein [Pyrinomonadaceae bacterium]
MKQRTHLLLAAIFLFGSMTAASDANAQTADRFGAIAYSPSTGRFGSSWNQPDQGTAEDRARKICNRRDCQILLPLANSCGALAVARNGGYVWAGGNSLYNAKLSTSNRCTAEHGSCKLICSVCSGGDTP